MASINKKERFVTRTISSTIVSVKCYNKDTEEMETITKSFSGKIDAKENEYEVYAAFDSMKYRAVKILECKVTECRYKLSEIDFIKYGTPITEKEAAELEAE